MTRPLIYHAFVGSCVESEVLSEYGTVVGLGLAPTRSSTRNVDAWIRCDLSRDPLPVDRRADFALLHPPCGRFSVSTPEDRRADHPDLIERAREIAPRLADEWVIENVLTSPLSYGANLRLRGSHFGLELKYERVFETSFQVEAPDVEARHFGFEHTVASVRKEEARELKGYSGDYHVHDLVRNSLPSAYVRLLCEAAPTLPTLEDPDGTEAAGRSVA